MQSQAISTGDKTQSLGGFTLSVPLDRIQQKGEDYFFVKDTWGSKEMPVAAPPTTDPPPLPPARSSPNVTKKPMQPAQPVQSKPLPKPKPHPPKTQSQAQSPTHPMSHVPLPPVPTATKSRPTHASKSAASSDGKPPSSVPPSRQPPRKPAPYHASKPALPPSTPLVEEMKKKHSLNRQASAPIHSRGASGQPSGRLVSRKGAHTPHYRHTHHAHAHTPHYDTHTTHARTHTTP